MKLFLVDKRGVRTAARYTHMSDVVTVKKPTRLEFMHPEKEEKNKKDVQQKQREPLS